ncbi:MAG: hypothetical protein ABIE22_05015 [archaeon]
MKKESNFARLLIFCGFLVLALFLWRLNVYFFYSDGSVNVLRESTGLNIHHFHYGVLFVLIAVLIMMFFSVNYWSVGLAGFGFGSILDSLVSSLTKESVRIQEIVNYNNAFEPTLLVFIITALIVVIFYLVSEKLKK